MTEEIVSDSTAAPFELGLVGLSLSVLPFGEVSLELLQELADDLGRLFGFRVGVAAPLGLPSHALDLWRRQHRSSAFLSTLAAGRRQPVENFKLLGVTAADLFVPGLNFVFGEADRRHGVAIISLARLQPQAGGSAALALFKLRMLKEAIHELGHVLGLRHCASPRCIMHFSHAIAETDNKGPGFCRSCLARLLRQKG